MSNGKGMTILLWGLVALVLVAVFQPQWLNFGGAGTSGAQSGAPAPSPTGQPTPAPISIQTFNPSDSVTFSIVTKNKQLIDQGVNTTYMAVKAYAIVDNKQFKSSTIDASSTGGSITGIGINKPVTLILENTTNIYTKKVDSGLIADSNKPIDEKVTEFSALKVRIYNHTDATYANAAANSVNLTSMGLTAGGSSQKYTFYGEVTDSYTTFGLGGIYVGCTGLKATQYVVGTNMQEVAVASFGIVSDDDKDRLWKSPLSSITSETGSIDYGYLDIKLKGGETAPATGINCTTYDHGTFLSIDTVSVKEGLNFDDSVSTDVGAANAHFVWEP